MVFYLRWQKIKYSIEKIESMTTTWIIFKFEIELKKKLRLSKIWTYRESCIFVFNGVFRLQYLCLLTSSSIFQLQSTSCCHDACVSDVCASVCFIWIWHIHRQNNHHQAQTL